MYSSLLFSEEFENADLFLWLSLISTQAPKRGFFRKRSWNRRNLKMQALRFRAVEYLLCSEYKEMLKNFVDFIGT